MLLSEVFDELIDHPISPLSTNQGSSHLGSHAVVGEPFHKTSRKMNLWRHGRQGQLDRFRLPGECHALPHFRYLVFIGLICGIFHRYFSWFMGVVHWLQARRSHSITPFPLSRGPWLLCLLTALSLPMRLWYGGLHFLLLWGAAHRSTLVGHKSCSRFAFTCSLLCMSHKTQWLPLNVVRKIACPFYDASRFYIGLNHVAQPFHQSASEGVAWRNMHVCIITFSHRESMEADYGSLHSSSLPFSLYTSSLLIH